MALTTQIQWADTTWNPWIGCTKVSEGCSNCYAEVSTPSKALNVNWGKGKPRYYTKNWRKLLWFKPVTLPDGKVRKRRVFLSLCDWLDDEVPISRFLALLHVMYLSQLAGAVDLLMLTKRPELWRKRLTDALAQPVSAWWEFANLGANPEEGDPDHFRCWVEDWLLNRSWPLNVWFGFSAENQKRFDQRYEAAKDIPIGCLFCSAEPLLDRITIDERLDWVIVGGESIGGRRCDTDWIRSIIGCCKSLRVPVFVKQLGSNPDDGQTATERFPILLKHRKGGDPAEWPEDLRVQQFPTFRLCLMAKQFPTSRLW